ncbi:MAG: glycosyltransferase family 4 protein [Planctomycetaceae bacterium]
MRIAITVDPNLPVPPRLYGGIERIVDFLVRGLVARGHDVTLLAHPDSDTPATLVPYGVPPHTGTRPRMTEVRQVGSFLWKNRNRFDVVHSFGRLAALLPILPCRRLAKIQSYQRDQVPWRSVRVAERLAGRSLLFTGCSSSVYRDRATGEAPTGDWRTVFNGVDLAKYEFTSNVPADAPLAFLGRLERFKGAHCAVEIARQAGRRLVIAGNRVTDGDDPDYFSREIEPHIDGDRVQYVGPVDDRQKNDLLRSAGAFLMPILWDEPFGIVMAEALACGTPVIAFARGSVPEVVQNGVNGFACRDVAEAVAAVPRALRLDRSAVRADCESRFGSEVIVAEYERLYREMSERSVRSAQSVLRDDAAAVHEITRSS